MKTLLSILVLAPIFISCTPTTSPQGASGKLAKSVDVQALIAQFDANYLAAAELQEDSALIRLNPCRDSVSNSTQNGTSGTFTIPNYSFSYDFSNGVTANGDCEINFNPSMNAYRKTIRLYNDAPAPVSGDYTIISLVANANLVLYNSPSTASMTILNTESAFTTESIVPEANDNIPYFYISRYQQMGDFNDHAVASSFSFDQANNDQRIESVSSRLGRLNAPQNFNSDITGSDNASVKDFNINEIQLVLTGDETQGLYYFAVFPSVLSEQEKTLALCHAMVIAAKAGKTEVLVKNYSLCGLSL